MYTRVCIYSCILYIYIYIYMYREREIERYVSVPRGLEGGPQRDLVPRGRPGSPQPILK